MSKCQYRDKGTENNWVSCSKRKVVNVFTGKRNLSQEIPVFECKHCPENPINKTKEMSKP